MRVSISSWDLALRVLHYVYPFSIFSYYISASTITICINRKQSSKPASRKLLSWVMLGVMTGILCSHVGAFSRSYLTPHTDFGTVGRSN
jgi:hypothetical protein